MSEAEENRRDGFEALLEVSGESLVLALGDRTIKGVRGLVNRAFDPAMLSKGAVDFDERNRSEIEVLKCKLTDELTGGRTFRDSAGVFHRIETIRATDITYRLECIVNPPDTDE